MNWKQLIDGSFIYINTDGKEVGNVSLVGKNGRWRWQSSLKKPLQNKGWWGMASSSKEAQKIIENYIKEYYDSNIKTGSQWR
jgi:hypothetical protein